MGAYVVISGGVPEEHGDVEVFDLDAFSTEGDYTVLDLENAFRRAVDVGAAEVCGALYELIREKIDSEHADLFEDVKGALEGDSNDAEHDALVGVASYFGIEYTPDDGLDDDDEDDE